MTKSLTIKKGVQVYLWREEEAGWSEDGIRKFRIKAAKNKVRNDGAFKVKQGQDTSVLGGLYYQEPAQI